MPSSPDNAASVTVTIDDGVAVIRIDDGKRNAVSPDVVAAIDAALDRAEAEATAVCLLGREGTFSAGFDLKVMTSTPEAARDLLTSGAQLLMRLYGHPQPTVAGATGHALAMGALLLLACDTRFAAQVEAKIGLNEVAIGMTLPIFAAELARDRLATNITRGLIQAELADPDGAVTLGYVDHVVAAADLEQAAISEARRLGQLPGAAYGGSKRVVRQATIDHVLATLDENLRGAVPQPR